MDSGTITEDPSDAALNLSARCRWTEHSIVYTRRRFHRKPNPTTNNYDTTAASPAASPAAAAGTAQNPTTTAALAEVSPTADAAPTTADVPASSASEDPSTAPADHGGRPTSRPAGGITMDDFLQEPREAVVANEQNVRQESLDREQVHDSVDKSLDFSDQQAQLREQRQDGERILENNDSTAHQKRESSGSRDAELENLQDSPADNINDARNSKSPNGILQTSDGGEQNVGDSSPLSGKNDMPDGREDPAAQLPIRNGLQNDGDLMPLPPEVPSGNGPAIGYGVVRPLVISRVNDKVLIKLAKSASKDAFMELRSNLECEVNQVRRVVEQLEAKELQLASNIIHISDSSPSDSNYIGTREGGNIGGNSFLQPQHVQNDPVDRRVLVRIRSGMGAMGQQVIRPTGLVRVNSDMGTARNLLPGPFRRQLSVSVMGSNHRAGEFVEKERRTPKTNNYYRNSEFLLGRDRLPPENVKRLKTNNGRKHGGHMEKAFGFALDKSRNQVFKGCKDLLLRLMKHKHGWVFNEPVNAKALGLVDYHDIIKHPMDLGTIKTRLSQNWYQTSREFAEDVRLVFQNAMTYNPKGQDVHFMADELSQIFEEKWAAVEAECSWKYQMYQDVGMMPTPTSRMARLQSHVNPASAHAPAYISAPAGTVTRTLDRPEAVTTPMAVVPKVKRRHVGRPPVPKKPKAKDLNKRGMSYDEKQKLSTNLQSMPAEKLDAIVQIIKKRNTALSQHEDEIEVDIDNVDTETLWELDRFVSNYKKNLSKNKRKAELALQARSVGQTVGPMNTATSVADAGAESGAASPLAIEGENQGYNGRSSSSSSSSSDSGSSSSDSDSDSSSENGSDAGHSPGT